ncbi:MAG: repressor LexA [Candidatus Zambryskibacteria bacterium RIFCSPLOWO2_02_FULL_39_26]|uniref:Repressor LexA n=1 Tax=Candidatus Zambryskibacteria bacterium RIFCSPLOWO2_12_FULL_39_23 TaxID=1802776 RepID=A0A1G2UT38_9BACT|nr:MAG: repressor LexA [Candidatus Zambryskibacteria bacterium RIFCSPHIGHO2_02_39_10]OHA99689.1 MAG: repressor LexA [Candidatus Zambryskibacteria bacterium RIFCSPHIGHO2_12_FULL_39_47]OHB09485.1 MAG: repressor LexA [Candidatus Zambryskibacteria bacterium RIFCSPLOWO2_02_FULL_39_26]OHB12553.1 MAG: repressor LexA [Candidatus Zambryskibacteria bacterium RIFCSPLOWO2_12_FULL_39_23]
MYDEKYTKYKNKILDFYRKNRRMPGYKEIMTLVGFKSKNAVYKLINKMVDDEIIDKDSNGRLTPMKIFGQVPLLGLVEAGIPTSVEEDNSKFLSLDEYMLGDKKSPTYLLEVKGDSMIDEGIREGDLVLAERRGDPKDGDIVIAEVDGGWTMKYFKKKGNLIYLKAANRNYSPIYPQYDLKVAAIVRGVIRKY